MSFWTSQKLQHEIQLGNLVSDFLQTRIDCNAYTLRMGAEFYCTSDATRPIWKPAKKRTLKDRESFMVPAGQFAFLLTKETVRVPPSAMAFISMKASIKFQGLINVSGFHVDPGYDGHLVFSVYNAGPSGILLEEGMDMFLIWYSDLDGISDKKRADNDRKTISNSLLKGMTREILSLQSLSQEIADLRLKMKFQWAIFGIGAAIFLTIVGFVLNFAFQKGLESIYKTQTSASQSVAPASQASLPGPKVQIEHSTPQK